MNEAKPRFPVFISLDGRDVLVVGGGAVALRRARVLLEFGAAVTVVAPEITPGMRELLGRIKWRRERYTGLSGDNTAYALAIAATSDAGTNRQIGEDAKKAGILVSVADRKESSDFWFPAIMRGGGLVAGMVSERGESHGAVKRAAERIRLFLEED